jgi:transposase
LVVQRAIAEGLVGGEGFAVDASLIAADANKLRIERTRYAGGIAGLLL